MAAQYPECKDARLHLPFHAISPHGRTEGQIYRADQGGRATEERHLSIEECIPQRKRCWEQGAISDSYGHEMTSQVHYAFHGQVAPLASVAGLTYLINLNL